MRDLLTNIKKAIEILNKTKNLTISLTDPTAVICDTPPVGVSLSEYKKMVEENVKGLYFTAHNLYINFDCSFDYNDLKTIEGPSTEYMEAMRRIMTEIYDRYKWAFNMGGVGSINKQSTVGSNTYNNTSGWSLGNTILQSSFGNLNMTGDLDVNGEINADDIKVNGGQLSVSSELDDLKKKSQALEAELDALKAMLASKGVLD